PTPAHGGHPAHTRLSTHAARCSVRNACTKASSLSLGNGAGAPYGVATMRMRTRTAKPWMLSRRVLWYRLAPPLTQLSASESEELSYLAIFTVARSNTCCKHVVR
ncbi:hypothetical protein B0H12DRAFT_1093034, partial [Mycena haematopus]